MYGPLNVYGSEWMIQVLVMLDAEPQCGDCQGLPARSCLAGKNIPVRLERALAGLHIIDKRPKQCSGASFRGPHGKGFTNIIERGTMSARSRLKLLRVYMYQQITGTILIYRH